MSIAIVSTNGQMAGAAACKQCLLGKATGKASYTTQGHQALDWLRATLYNASDGRIFDHIDPDGRITDWAFTYNQGTFIGASTLASQIGFKNHSYVADPLADAKLAAEWAQQHLTGSHAPGILNDEYGPDGGMGDGVGFKGIFARWCAEYIRVSKDQNIGAWLSSNNDAAWNNRNAQGITWGQWWHRTPDYCTSWEASSAAAVTQT